ncbi:hypothetical protein [Candidatus Nitrosotenuis cloacae]|uniref:hypothetical protein n=1 Tax=Candidatus Nitrosotenuis cloacae TaxID=1603555 RepID=UPI00227E1100|nr:hypothetical protein [Candidatus Nitrosotenuis cloacae]
MKVLTVLATRSEISSNVISRLLADTRHDSYPHSRVKNTLIRLADSGYVRQKQIEQKKQIQNNWTITPSGILTYMLFTDDKNYRELIDSNSERTFFRTILILDKSEKRGYVDNLIELLKKSSNNPLEMEKIALSWYSDIRKRIKDLKINSEKYPELYKLRKEIKNDDMMLPVFLSKPHNASKPRSTFGTTFVDSIFQRYS